MNTEETIIQLLEFVTSMLGAFELIHVRNNTVGYQLRILMPISAIPEECTDPNIISIKVLLWA